MIRFSLIWIKRKKLKSDGIQSVTFMCVADYPFPEAVHIIDQKEWKIKYGTDSKDNGIP